MTRRFLLTDPSDVKNCWIGGEQLKRKHVGLGNLKTAYVIKMEGMMVDVDTDHFAYDYISGAGRQPFALFEADIERGLFDEADDDRIDSDGNPLEQSDDEVFDDTADADYDD